MKDRWPIKKLGDLSERITKGTTPTSIGYRFQDVGIRFIKVESISESGSFLPAKIARISNECHQALKRSQLVSGDILFSIAGALGRTALVTQDILPANTNQALAIIRLKSDINLSRRYVLAALNTGFVLGQVERSKGGVAQQNLSLAQIRDFDIPIPPLDEQERIVALLDDAFCSLNAAKVETEKKLIALEELRSSILHMAFSGEL